MATIIVAFPKIEEAKAVKNLLVRRGYDVAVPCTTGAQVILQADALSDGIILSGYKLSDNMLYTELNEYKPKSFELLLVASRDKWVDCQDNDIVCTEMPVKVHALLDTIEMMLQAQISRRRKRRSQPRRRSPQEQRVIDSAKALLMEKNNMTEQEAFRYIQKCSMDSGNTMAESASMVLGIYENA
ncbi:MAG: ANTAR domain-containing protein [Eubacteriales bacterium]|nr:ANTAR domain-containing protein [Eubacteriales bacterium]